MYICMYVGREIDEQGNVVKMDQRVKTIAANAAIEAAQKKKENPYLAHKSVVPGNASVIPGLASVPGMAGQLQSVFLCMYDVSMYVRMYVRIYVFKFMYICMYVGAGLVPEVADDRLPVAPRRDLRAKKGLKFVEAGYLLSIT